MRFAARLRERAHHDHLVNRDGVRGTQNRRVVVDLRGQHAAVRDDERVVLRRILDPAIERRDALHDGIRNMQAGEIRIVFGGIGRLLSLNDLEQRRRKQKRAQRRGEQSFHAVTMAMSAGNEKKHRRASREEGDSRIGPEVVRLFFEMARSIPREVFLRRARRAVECRSKAFAPRCMLAASRDGAA
ncbi:hypothetical protein BURKHO8Y_110432 [Burkholderia sp. 8Y]|nr:hypothetical protein BURKHO8Y_110432 [Burkholderia sp. 8Y]